MVTRNRKKEKPYLERDISWMYFNRRILQEATRSHVPLLERMAFLGIYSNNLDEFFPCQSSFSKPYCGMHG